jgi:glycine/D-amino acid oxidase-like deaminating enzyme
VTKGSDVVVIGGGIVGCACAYELASSGASVTLVERAELAAGASGRNHGLLLTPPDPDLVPMAKATLTAYQAFAQRTDLPIGMDEDPVGYLVVAPEDPPERTAARVEAEAASQCGVQVERIDADGLRELEPELDASFVEGWLFQDGRRLQPGLLTAGLAQAAASEGAVVRTHLTARALWVERDRVRGVVTDEGRIASDEVILAAGPWSPPFLRPIGVSLPVLAARGWLVSVSPKLPPLQRLVSRAGWHAPPDPDTVSPIDVGSFANASEPPGLIGTMLQPNADGTMLIGGSRQPAFTPEPEDQTVPRRLLAGATEMVPSLSTAAMLGAWWGIRPMSPDGRPMVGAVKDGLMVATGHGSLGVILGGGTGQLIASMVMGKPSSFDAAPFDPLRFG